MPAPFPTRIALLAVVFCGFWSVGCKCGDDDGGGHAQANAPLEPPPRADPRYPHSILRPACTPTGARAVSLMLAKSGADCGQITSERISIFGRYGGELRAPLTLDLGGSAGDGSGTKCPEGGGACVVAVGGHATFDRVGDAGASGTWSLTFADGNVEQGTFAAKWCPATDTGCR